MRHATPTLLLLVACGGEPAPDTPLCSGGGDPWVETGMADGDFASWSDEPIALLDQDGGGSWGLDLETRVSGLDVDSGPLTLLIRIPWEGTATEDYLASVAPGCDEAEGIDPITVRAPLPEEFQADPAPLLGPGLSVTVVLSDSNGTALDGSWTVELQQDGG